MQFGAHLPLIELEAGRLTLTGLRAARRVAELGYRFLCANDHLLVSRPWLDGPTALAATLDQADGMSVATTVCLPVIRGPAPTAKMLTALDELSGGRLVAGVGPGSSPRDYAAIGGPFEERWSRFDAAVRELRPLLHSGPPVWIASWGSPAGLRRVARLGDGWLASGYNTTPARFRASAAFLADECAAAGESELPNGVATMWL